MLSPAHVKHKLLIYSTALRAIGLLLVLAQLTPLAHSAFQKQYRFRKPPCESTLDPRFKPSLVALPEGDTIQVLRSAKVFGPKPGETASRYGLELMTAVKEHFPTQAKEVLVLGAATGYEAIYIARNRDDVNIVATDILDEAIEIGALNAELHGVTDRVQFIQSNLFENVQRRFDVILFNAPRPVIYELVKAHERWMTPEYFNRGIQRSLHLPDLFDPHGNLLLRLMQDLPEHLEPGGSLFLMSDSKLPAILPALFTGKLLREPMDWVPGDPAFGIHQIQLRAGRHGP